MKLKSIKNFPKQTNAQKKSVIRQRKITKKIQQKENSENPENLENMGNPLVNKEVTEFDVFDVDVRTKNDIERGDLIDNLSPLERETEVNEAIDQQIDKADNHGI